MNSPLKRLKKWMTREDETVDQREREALIRMWAVEDFLAHWSAGYVPSYFVPPSKEDEQATENPPKADDKEEDGQSSASCRDLPIHGVVARHRGHACSSDPQFDEVLQRLRGEQEPRHGMGQRISERRLTRRAHRLVRETERELWHPLAVGTGARRVRRGEHFALVALHLYLALAVGFAIYDTVRLAHVAVLR